MSGYAEECVTHEVERVVKARKAHTCCACKRTILPGERYMRDAMLFEGKWETYVRCGACEATYAHLVRLCMDSDNDMWPERNLGCGLRYQAEWGDLPDDVAALAFMTNAEASALLEGKEP